MYNNRRIKYFLLLIILLVSLPSTILAVREPRPTSLDSRIRVLTYRQNDVFKFTGYYNYLTCIELDKGEEIINLSMGDRNAWFIENLDNRLFLKPIQDDATTNMLLITNKRTYFFELHAEEVRGIRDPNIVFYVRFLYPYNDTEELSPSLENQKDPEPDLSHPENYNFYYTISGHQDLFPTKIFDDGEFTYIYFKNKNVNMPTVYASGYRNRESIVNFRMSTSNPNLMIVERIHRQLTLRFGRLTVYVYNEVALRGLQ